MVRELVHFRKLGCLPLAPLSTPLTLLVGLGVLEARDLELLLFERRLDPVAESIELLGFLLGFLHELYRPFSLTFSHRLSSLLRRRFPTDRLSLSTVTLRRRIQRCQKLVLVQSNGRLGQSVN